MTNIALELVQVPTSHNVVDFKWLYHIKTKSDGCVDKYKARLVGNDFTQCPVVDYHLTFNPIVKPFIDQLVLSLVDHCNCPLY